LADTDDWTMTPHTFEAVVASYGFDDLGLTLVGANVQRWQGVDTDYENVTNNSWVDTGDSSTNMLAALYASDNIEAGAWYYDVSKAAKAVYVDASVGFEFSEDMGLSLSLQYLNESEEDSSGIDGSISGAMVEGALMGIDLSVAYNFTDVDNGKSLFEGFGGGCSYTNMFVTTAGGFNDGTYGDASSYSLSLGYDISVINLYGAYAEFEADDIGTGKGDKSEMDLVATYTYNDGLADVSLGYVKVKDKIDSANSFNRIQFFANYNF
ncbi:MAG: hypothetical protein JXQ66_06165, partial [Campylobacterales bacterium]|nr:hypothetical protein [Campylobacterales bacterium]